MELIKMFDVDLLKSHLKHQGFLNCIVYLRSTRSTNEALWRLYHKSPKKYFVITDNQTFGRGRGLNSWVASPNQDITCSFILNQVFTLEKFNFHSLIIPISIVRGIQKHLSLNLKIKWPNDIMYNNHKVGGILIETKKHSKQRVLNVGIGINVNESKKDLCDSIKDQALSLKMIYGKEIQREVLLANILNELYGLIKKNSFSRIILEWEKNCNHINNEVLFKYNKKNVRGLFESINSQGQAVIRLKNKSINYDGAIKTL